MAFSPTTSTLRNRARRGANEGEVAEREPAKQPF
jgi:hypothetical protein